jgi:cysteine desulfurase
LGKLTSKNIYCDYNSTSPLSNSVTQFLGSGDFLFANASSTHQLGKASKKAIREVSEYLLSLYGQKPSSRSCIFHSGATEGLNSAVLGVVYFHLLEKGKSVTFFYSGLDHSCIINLCPLLKLLGVKTIELPIDKNGALDTEKAQEVISLDRSEIKVLNYTWVNNETGLVQPLDLAAKLKESTQCIVVVDAVQSPGKIPSWNELEPSLDVYVFSAHKFGALKGVGFTLLSDSIKLSPTIFGGGQQNGLRSGTENIMGIMSIKLAFEDLVEQTQAKDYFQRKSSLTQDIESHILNIIGNDSMMVSKKLKNRNINTICFVSPTTKANIVMMAMDLSGLQVSSGSACSSGASLPSRVLLKLGYSSEQAHGGIRLSFPPTFCENQAVEVKKRLTQTLGKYYHS